MKHGLLALFIVGFAVGCTNKLATKKNMVEGINQGSEAPLVGLISMSVRDVSGTVLYSDAVPTSTFVLRATENYILRLDTSNVPVGSTFSLEVRNISVVNSTPTVRTLLEGDNSFSVATQGTYALRVIVSAPGLTQRTQDYQLSATCPQPTFTADSLSGVSISVSGTNNIWQLSASGFGGLNGLPPYECAFDPTGVQIVHTPFQSCNNSVNNFYVDLLGARNVGLVVRDACGVAHTISRPVNYAYSIPASPGNVFIYGETSSSCVNCDSRYEPVQYLATNQGAPRPVTAMYGNGSFTIESALRYSNMPTSIVHGIRIEIRGIQETIPLNAATMSGDIDVSNAYIHRLVYSTDRGGDSQSQAVLTASQENCSFNPRNGRVIPTQGTPCSDGSGTGNSVSVEVWGDYVCTNMTGGANGPVTIQGRFDGYYTIVDNCVGGGGGGGVPPITL